MNGNNSENNSPQQSTGASSSGSPMYPNASYPSSPKPGDPIPPHRGRSFFWYLKTIFLSIFGIICIFGIIQVVSQTFFPPENKTKSVKLSPESTVWETYVNKNNSYSVSYPDTLELSETKYTTVFTLNNSSEGIPGFPLLYVSVIPDGFENDKEVYNFMSQTTINKIFSLRDSESIQTEAGPDSEYWTFTRLAAFSVSGSQGVMIENKNVYQGQGLINRRILVRGTNKTYIIGSYYSTQQELNALQMFLNSFKII